MEVLASDRKLHLARPLSEEELTIPSIIIFNGLEGLSRKSIHRCTGEDPAAALARLQDEGLNLHGPR